MAGSPASDANAADTLSMITQEDLDRLASATPTPTAVKPVTAPSTMTPEAKRAALAAAAEGGNAGLTAYREADLRQRESLGQTLDTVLGAAQQRRAPVGAGEELSRIINAAHGNTLGRISQGADRFSTSQDARQKALDAYLATAPSIEQLYAQAAAADAARRGGGGGGGGDYTRGEKEDIAWGVGQQNREAAVAAETAANDKRRNDAYLAAVTEAVGGEFPLLIGDYTARLMRAETPEQQQAILDAAAEAGAKAAGTTRSTVSHGWYRPGVSRQQRSTPDASGLAGLLTGATGSTQSDDLIGPLVDATPAERQRTSSAIEEYLTPGRTAYEDTVREITPYQYGVHDNEFAAQAYVDLGFGSYEEGLGVFKDNPSAILGDVKAMQDLGQFGETGMTMDQVEDADLDATTALFTDIALSFGGYPSTITKVLEDTGLPAEAFVSLLDPDGGGGSEFVSRGLDKVKAYARTTEGGAFKSDDDMVKDAIARAAREAAEEAMAAGADENYAAGIGAVVAEQASVYLNKFGSGYFTGG